MRVNSRQRASGQICVRVGRMCGEAAGHGKFPPNRAPTEAQRSGFGGKRTSDRVTELCRSRRSEGYVVREDDGQHRVCLDMGHSPSPANARFRAEARTHFKSGGTT